MITNTCFYSFYARADRAFARGALPCFPDAFFLLLPWSLSLAALPASASLDFSAFVSLFSAASTLLFLLLLLLLLLSAFSVANYTLSHFTIRPIFFLSISLYVTSRECLFRSFHHYTMYRDLQIPYMKSKKMKTAICSASYIFCMCFAQYLRNEICIFRSRLCNCVSSRSLALAFSYNSLTVVKRRNSPENVFTVANKSLLCSCSSVSKMMIGPTHSYKMYSFINRISFAISVSMADWSTLFALVSMLHSLINRSSAIVGCSRTSPISALVFSTRCEGLLFSLCYVDSGLLEALSTSIAVVAETVSCCALPLCWSDNSG